MGFIVLLLLIGLAMIGGPFFYPVPAISRLVLTLVGTALTVVSIVLIAIGQWYQRASAEEALVRTGMGGSKVIIDGGILVFPVVHRLTRVSLKVIKLMCVREGPDALITKDYLRADVHSEFYMRVGATSEQVLNAARSFGEQSGQEDAIDQKVGEKLISALRSVAAKHELAELHSDRESFASAVQELVAKEIEPNGLILETVTISRLDQTDPGHLNDNNVFDAQGKRKITEITTAALVARNELERSAEQATTEKNVSTRKSVLMMQQDQAFAEAEQQMQINKVQAEKQREADVYRIEQEKQTQQAQIIADQTVRQADIAKEQTIQTTEVDKVKAVEVATRDQQIAIAQKEAERAAAEKAKLEAEAAREQANQEVKTVEVVATAQRQSKQQIIVAETEAQQSLIRKQKEADAVAYQKQKEAEGELRAAENSAVQIALANAIGSFVSQGSYTVYGTPDTMAQMMEKLSTGLGVGAFLDGVGKSVLGGNGEKKPAETVTDLAGILGGVIKKATGKDIELSPELAEQIAALVTSSLPKPEGASKAAVQATEAPAEGGQRKPKAQG